MITRCDIEFLLQQDPLIGGSLLLTYTTGYVAPLLLAASFAGALQVLHTLPDISSKIFPRSISNTFYSVIRIKLYLFLILIHRMVIYNVNTRGGKWGGCVKCQKGHFGTGWVDPKQFLSSFLKSFNING